MKKNTLKKITASALSLALALSLAACSSEEGSGDKDTAGGENEDGTRTVVVGTNGSGEALFSGGGSPPVGSCVHE